VLLLKSVFVVGNVAATENWIDCFSW